jgi:hypothetical protein
MTIAHAIALLNHADPREIDAMTPAERQRIANALRFWLHIIDPLPVVSVTSSHELAARTPT